MGKKDDGADISNNPDICMATGDFTLPNGDKYSGEYCAHRAGIIWRQGKGVYTSHEGQIYEGNWVDDKLQEDSEIVINFPTGEIYHGRLSKYKYTGPGIYTLSNGLDLSCEFNGNKPTGEIVLIDFNGKLWRGNAENENAILLPENVFYLTISNQQGIGVIKDEFLELNDEMFVEDEGEEEEEYSDEYWRKIIFAKNQFIKNDVKFGDSKWFKDIERFQKRKKEIEQKIKKNQYLNCNDQLWLAKFYQFKDKIDEQNFEKEFQQWKAEKEIFDLNRKFESPEFLNSSPEYKIIRPSFQPESSSSSPNSSSSTSSSKSTSGLSFDYDIDTKSEKSTKSTKRTLIIPEIEKFAQTLERLSSEESITEKVYAKPEKQRLHFTPDRRNKILLPRINLLVHEKLFADDDETKNIIEIKNMIAEGNQENNEEEEDKIIVDEVNQEIIQEAVPKEVLTEQQIRIKKLIEDKVAEWEKNDVPTNQTSITIKETPHMHSVAFHTNELDDIPTEVLIDMFKKRRKFGK